MKNLKIVPVYHREKKAFVIQKEKTLFNKIRYWSDVKDLNGNTIIIDPEFLQDHVSHLMKEQLL